LWRAQAGDFQTQDYVPVEVGVWFWYYVVAVWAVLFTVLYLV
jgi:heme/copper-type cytochrome/quinol oxidase subunit 3